MAGVKSFSGPVPSVQHVALERWRQVNSALERESPIKKVAGGTGPDLAALHTEGVLVCKSVAISKN